MYSKKGEQTVNNGTWDVFAGGGGRKNSFKKAIMHYGVFCLEFNNKVEDEIYNIIRHTIIKTPYVDGSLKDCVKI